MSALDVAQAICRLVRRSRPEAQGGARSGSDGPPHAAAPTEFVDGSWRIIGAGGTGAARTSASSARRIVQLSAPLAVGAAVTGGTLLVCQALGLPSKMMDAGRVLLAGEALPEAGGDAAAVTSLGEGIEQLMTGPSLFRPGAPNQETIMEAGRPLAPPDPAPVPEPASVALLGIPLALLVGLALRATARRCRSAPCGAGRRRGRPV